MNVLSGGGYVTLPGVSTVCFDTGWRCVEIHQEYDWGPSLDIALRQIEQLQPSDAARWILAGRAVGHDNASLYLQLALATTRYVDHHGPLIGHGIINASPALRAPSILAPAYQDLALLHMTCYVIELLQDPNYGPYLLTAMQPVDEETIEESERAFLESVESGEQVLLAEHRLVGLVRRLGPAVRRILTLAALRQYPENEHRLLIVHRSAQLLDDADGWAYAEPFFRAAVQYLANRPRRYLPEAATHLEKIGAHQGGLNPMQVEAGMQRLVEAPYGAEPNLLVSLIEQGVQGRALYEVVALTGSELLCRSRFDAHAVTGLHCILDLLQDANVTGEMRGLAWSASLSGQRIRRQKEHREGWRLVPPVAPAKVAPEELRAVVQNDPEGMEALRRTGAALLGGADPVAVARILMEVALTTAGPFAALHNLKMVWGLLLETLRSRLPQLSWRHLAAGARVIAESAARGRQDAAPVLTLWHQAGLSGAFMPDKKLA